MAKKENLEINQGTSWGITLIVKDAATGNVVDLTGYSVAMQLKTNHKASATLSLTSDDDSIVITAAEGKIVFALTPDQTRVLENEYLYDIEITDTDGGVIRVIQGIIVVDPEVTT